jgi:hypothetical protein
MILETDWHRVGDSTVSSASMGTQAEMDQICVYQNVVYDPTRRFPMNMVLACFLACRSFKVYAHRKLPEKV